MWKSINYEVCGRSHAKFSIPCQDKTLACNINGIEIIALADGAGSAKFSHFGAVTVTESISEYIAQNFIQLLNDPDGKQAKKDIIEYLLSKLNQKSKELSCEIKDLASTLLMVAVNNDTFIMLHIGDGVIGYLKENELKVASMPENGEFANTTTFVTSREAISTMKLFKGVTDDIAGFVLMSDGTAESFYHKKNKVLANVLIKMMHRTTILTHDKMYNMIKNSFDQVVVLNTQDDCSIALLSRNIGVLCSYSDMTFQQKCELLNILAHNKSANKRIKRFDDIMYYLESKKTVKQLSGLIHLKEKHTRRRLTKLESIGLVSKDGDFYSRAL